MAEREHDSWTYQGYCDAIGAEAARFAAAVRGADPAAPVPTCPGWSVADLVEHHGRSQRRVTWVLRHRSQQPVWAKDVPLDIPGDPAGYPAWLTDGARALLDALRSTDPATPLWTNGRDRDARYWARRILYEAVVHRADAEFASGRDPVVDAPVGKEGIDELLTNLPSFGWVADRQRGLDRDGDTLHLHATDLDAGWMITVGDGGFTWTHGHGEATAGVLGAAGDLLLLVYGRLRPDAGRFAVTGEEKLLVEWLEKSSL